MSKQSIGVFSWNVAKLVEAVSAMEAEGHFVRGYEITKFSGYSYAEHDKLVFLEYAPDVLESWKAKAAEIGMKVAAEIDMPETPRGYGDPIEADFPPTKDVKEKASAPVREGTEEKPSPAKSAKKTG